MDGDGKVFCKCEEGLKCIITKTKGPDAGKVYLECGDGCSCGNVTDEGSTTSSSVGGGKVLCNCDDGFACEIYMITKAPSAGKAFSNCAEGCNCVITTA